MSADDLDRPLGLPTTQPPGRKAPLSTGALAALCLGVIGMGAAAYVWIRDDGRAGWPRVVVDIQDPAKAPRPIQMGLADSQPTASIPEESGNRSTGAEVERASGVRVVRRDDDAPPGALIIRVPESAPTIALAPAPDRQLTEKGAHGPLPRISADGRRPMNVYARPVATSTKLPSNAPRIAIMIGGMGLSQNATRHALEKLPPPVTLAFAPYGQSLAGQVAHAREQGHEVILQAPMEPYDLAGDGPGPRMLRTAAAKAEIRDNLHWLMSRFPGYVGVANFLGAKFLADPSALAAVIEETGSRGLFLLDDGSSPQSLVGKVASAAAAPYLIADLIIDADRSGAAIEKALLQLEAVAREKGVAVGVATGLPETVDRIAAFTASLERRGIALVPVSAAVVTPSRPTARVRISP